MTEQSYWGDLPADLLHSISSLFSSSVDLINMKLVCSSWHLVIKNPYSFRRLVSFPAFSTNDNKNARLLSIDNQKYTSCMKTLTSSYPGQEPRGAVSGTFSRFSKNNSTSIIGSHPDGWLIELVHRKYIRIRNFCTGNSIRVPNKTLGLEKIIRITTQYRVRRAILSHNPCTNQDFILVMICYPLPLPSSFPGIFFWRHGDDLWRPLPGMVDERSHYIDVGFRNYSLYALGEKPERRNYVIKTWDFGPCIPERKMVVTLSLRSRKIYSHTRLVLSPSGEIFIVSDPNKYCASEGRWKILKVDLGKKMCHVVSSLDGEALLYGDTSLLLVSSVDVQRCGYNPDSIYFVDSWDWSNTHHQGIKLKMYSFQDEKIREILDSDQGYSFSSCWMEFTTSRIYR